MFGTDLGDDGHYDPFINPSRLTWPALIASRLDLNYQCYAKPGSGNLQILERILSQSSISSQNDLFVIGWSWIDRFDYVDYNNDHIWKHNTLPPKTPWTTIRPTDTTTLSQTYYKEIHSQYHDKLSTLIYMKTAIDVLNQHNLKFIMIAIDELAFETEWEENVVIRDLQEYVNPYILRFDGETFLDWTNSKGFAISPTLHPLEDAHSAAADYVMREVFDKKNTTDLTQQVLF